MNSRITTADISDHFPIFLISEKELNYKQYKAIFESLKKKKSKKDYYSELIDSYK